MSPPTKSKNSIFRGFAQLSIGTIISRITGMLREVSLAFFLGSGARMDAYFIAYDLTNLFRHVLGEKVTESAMLPVYKRSLKEKGPGYTRDMIRRLLTLFVLISTLVTVLGIFICPWLIQLFAPGFSDETGHFAVYMTRVMFPFLIFISTASFYGAILLAHERFVPYSMAPILFNVSMIVILAVGVPRWGEIAAATGVLVGGILEFMIMIPFVPKEIATAKHAKSTSIPEVSKIGRLSLPILFETILEKTVIFFDRRLASLLIPGSISALGYAFRLIQLPYGVFVLAIARTFYPSMVDSASDIKQYCKCIGSALKFVFVILLPCAVMMAVLREPIVRIIYRHGAFDETAVSMTSLAFACYGVGLLGMGMQGILTRAFNALLDTRTPVFVSIGLTVTNVILNFVLVKTELKHGGLALATSTAYTLAGFTLMFLLRKKLKRHFHASIYFGIRRTIIQVFNASMAAGLSGLIVFKLLERSHSFFQTCLVLSSSATVFLLVYAFALKLQKFKLNEITFHRQESSC